MQQLIFTMNLAGSENKAGEDEAVTLSAAGNQNDPFPFFSI